MSLYLKYRPQDFGSVVGQEHVKKTLQAALLNETMAHAYLFCGPRGTGKTSMARILAKRINCQNPVNNEPCNHCEICTAIQQGRLVDLIEIDAASNRGIDEIRDLREKIMFSPTQAKSKVYIIDEVHMLTKEAFNALLKTLEEPPSHAYFILATTEAHKIPETIISRCQQFSFNRIELSDLTQRLQAIAQTEGGEAENEALELIAKLSNGGLRDAIGLLEQMMLGGKVTVEAVNKHLGLSGVDHLEKFFDFLIQKNASQALLILNEIKTQGKSLPQFIKEVIGVMRQKLHADLNDVAKTSLILNYIEIFLKARQQLDLSPIPELPLEMAIIKACGFEQAQALTDIAPKEPSPKNKSIPTEAEKAPTAQVQEEKMRNNSIGKKLDFDQIKRDWPRVMENIPSPFVKVSLNDGELAGFDAEVLTVNFKSATYLEKISNSSNQKEVQEAFEKIYGRQIVLNLQAKKVELSASESPSKTIEVKAPSTVDMAAEVFGIK